MFRFIASIIVGVVITFGLFVIMAELISSGSKSNSGPKENIRVEINTTPPESKAKQIRRVPPPPPPPPPQPPKNQPPEPDAPIDTGGPSFNLPTVNVGEPSAGLSGVGAIASDGDATPIVRIDPRYPAKAARDGTEGWVILSFDITETGTVDNVEVVDSKPRRVFDREARRALLKWKYRAKVVDGKPVRQTGLQVQLDFNLDGAN